MKVISCEGPVLLADGSSLCLEFAFCVSSSERLRRLKMLLRENDLLTGGSEVASRRLKRERLPGQVLTDDFELFMSSTRGVGVFGSGGAGALFSDFFGANGVSGGAAETRRGVSSAVSRSERLEMCGREKSISS